MDLTEIMTALIAGGGGMALIAAGGLALTRGKKKDSTRPAGKPGTPAGPSGSPSGKTRPPAPTWGDSLSAPAARPEATHEAGADSEQAAPWVPDVPESVDAPDAVVVESIDNEAAGSHAVDATDVAGSSETDVVEPASEPAVEPTGEPIDTEVETQQAIDEEDELEPEPVPEPEAPADIEVPEATADRMVRLRERLQRSGTIGRGILTLLSNGSIDANTWDEVEETLLLADLGPDATDQLMDALRDRIQVLGNNDPAAIREVLREELITLVNPDLDRRLAASAIEAPDGSFVPSVVMMVGVNGTGKTTTTGKFGRVLIAEGRTVVFGAADTFRAAAADQLQTWGERVGVTTVRSDREGADPASVAFDAVSTGINEGVDVVIIDTAGRLQNKKGLMDELGKIRRVASKALKGAEIQEVILVLDATTGQNGMQQARVFAEAVNVTGIALTKLDGTAKGGIVVNVQRELGVPVKLVGLGEGMDDLTPFDPYGFVDALLD